MEKTDFLELYQGLKLVRCDSVLSEVLLEKMLYCASRFNEFVILYEEASNCKWIRNRAFKKALKYKKSMEEYVVFLQKFNVNSRLRKKLINEMMCVAKSFYDWSSIYCVTNGEEIKYRAMSEMIERASKFQDWVRIFYCNIHEMYSFSSKCVVCSLNMMMMYADSLSDLICLYGILKNEEKLNFVLDENTINLYKNKVLYMIECINC